MSKLYIPSADDLDTRDCPRDYKVVLYLAPAEETAHSIPDIKIHAGVGNIGWPEPAHNNRWRSIGSYGAGAAGESVVEAIRAIESDLVALAGLYEGTCWDGNNHRGVWHEDAFDADVQLDGELIKYAWDAGE